MNKSNKKRGPLTKQEYLEETKKIWEKNKDAIARQEKLYSECSGEPIVYFESENKFLSNFYWSPILLRGYSFANGESAFQGFKDMNRIHEFEKILPSKAKSLGRQVSLRKDWEEIKYDLMKEVVFEKFSKNHQLKQKLLATENRLLVEGNWWNDSTWGVSNGKGENHLGRILMEVRKTLREQTN